MMCDPACSHWRILQHNKIGAFWRRRRQRSPESIRSASSHLGDQNLIWKQHGHPHGATYRQNKMKIISTRPDMGSIWDMLRYPGIGWPRNCRKHSFGANILPTKACALRATMQIPWPLLLQTPLDRRIVLPWLLSQVWRFLDLFGICFLINVLDQTNKTMQDMCIYIY